MATIADLAVLVRSKNAGPFWLTIDIMFDDADNYRRVRDSEAPLSSLPIRMTIGRRRRAAGRAKAPLRISPIRRADAAIPSSIATANLLRPPEPLLWVLPWPPPPGRVPLFYPGLARSVNTVPGDASLCCAGGKRARGLEPRLHLGAPPLVLCPASL